MGGGRREERQERGFNAKARRCRGAKRESDFKPEGTTGFNPRNMGKGNGEVGERLKAKIGKAGPKKRKKQGVLTTDDTDHTDFGLGQGRI